MKHPQTLEPKFQEIFLPVQVFSDSNTNRENPSKIEKIRSNIKNFQNAVPQRRGVRLAGASSRFAAYHILLLIQNIIRKKKEHEQHQKCEQVQKQNFTYFIKLFSCKGVLNLRSMTSQHSSYSHYFTVVRYTDSNQV